MHCVIITLVIAFASTALSKSPPAECYINFNYCNGESPGGGCEWICPTGDGTSGLPYEGKCTRYVLTNLWELFLSNYKPRNGAVEKARTGKVYYCTWP